MVYYKSPKLLVTDTVPIYPKESSLLNFKLVCFLNIEDI